MESFVSAEYHAAASEPRHNDTDENFMVFSIRCGCHPLPNKPMDGSVYDLCVIKGFLCNCIVENCPRWKTGKPQTSRNLTVAEDAILQAVLREHEAWLTVANQPASEEQRDKYLVAYGLYRTACARHL